MKRHLTYNIQPADAGETIASYLKAKGYTGKLLTALRHDPDDFLTRNQEKASTSEIIKEGDILEVTIYEKESSPNIIPEQLPIQIIYEDEDILVINKPAGMPIHPSVNHHTGTLANAVAGYYEKQGIPYVFRCMNRLDRDTSGVTVLAKNALSGAILSQTVKDGGFQKEYRAIVTGVTEEEGTISLPIGRKEGSIIERKIDLEQGQPAVTHFKRMGVYKGRDEITQYSYLKVKIETGRTHQIRVHMSAIGHPLPGDFLYNKDADTEATGAATGTATGATTSAATGATTSAAAGLTTGAASSEATGATTGAASKDFNTHPLHCARMSFEHPITKQKMELTAELPQSMKKMVK